MAMFVHLTAAKNVATIQRAGIRPGKQCFRFIGDQRGVFALPMTPNRLVTHQWLRELRRCGQREYCAVSSRIPDDEMVWIGFYNQPHEQITAAEATCSVLASIEEDPSWALGLEVIMPRSIKRAEIHRILPVENTIGWRYFPRSHGRKPCPFPCCLRPGEYGARKIRQRSSNLEKDIFQ